MESKSESNCPLSSSITTSLVRDLSLRDPILDVSDILEFIQWIGETEVTFPLSKC